MLRSDPHLANKISLLATTRGPDDSSATDPKPGEEPNTTDQKYIFIRQRASVVDADALAKSLSGKNGTNVQKFEYPNMTGIGPIDQFLVKKLLRGFNQDGASSIFTPHNGTKAHCVQNMFVYKARGDGTILKSGYDRLAALLSTVPEGAEHRAPLHFRLNGIGPAHKDGTGFVAIQNYIKEQVKLSNEEASNEEQSGTALPPCGKCGGGTPAADTGLWPSMATRAGPGREGFAWECRKEQNYCYADAWKVQDNSWIGKIERFVEKVIEWLPVVKRVWGLIRSLFG